MGNGKVAVVTGASSRIGKKLAKLCAENGYGLVVAADEPAIELAAEALRSHDVSVDAVEANLASEEGADKLIAEIGDRDIDLLLLNAGRGLGRGFVDQGWGEARRVIEYQRHRHGASRSTTRLQNDPARSRQDPVYRLCCRLHAGHLPAGLQRNQGIHRFFRHRAAS